MNTEHDKHLSALYGQTDREQPPAHLDAAILAAARRETHSRPHPAFTPFSNNWRVPVSLAAVLVLSISLVNLMDDAGTPTDGFTPLAIEEGEILPGLPDDAGKPAKESMGDAEQSPKRAKLDESDAGQHDFRSAPLEKSAPAPGKRRLAPAATPEPATGGLPEEVHARQGQEQKKNEQDLAQSSDRTSALGALSSNAPVPASVTAPVPVPTIDEIIALRKGGKLDQAGLAADVFVRHHFGDDLDKIDVTRVSLTDAEWKAIVQALRGLGRSQQADQLEKLRLDSLGKSTP